MTRSQAQQTTGRSVDTWRITIASRTTRAHATLYRAAARTLALFGRFDRARAILNRAATHCPSDAGTHLGLGILCSARGDNTAAVENLHCCLNLAPDCGDAHYTLGLLLSRTGQSVEAGKAFQQAARLSSDYRTIHQRFGRVALETNRPISLAESTARSRRFARVYGLLGCTRAAADEFEQLLIDRDRASTMQIDASHSSLEAAH